MKKILILLLLSSCQCILTQPTNQCDVAKMIEEIEKDLYREDLGPMLAPPLK